MSANVRQSAPSTGHARSAPARNVLWRHARLPARGPVVRGGEAGQEKRRQLADADFAPPVDVRLAKQLVAGRVNNGTRQ